MKKTILSILCLLTLSTNASLPLSVEVLKSGTGPKAADSDELLINYHLWIFDSRKPENKGNLVEKNIKRDQPAKLFLKKDKIINGLYEALIGQTTDTRLKVIVPAAQAYGAKKEGEIPANSDLIYEIEILSIIPKSGSLSH